MNVKVLWLSTILVSLCVMGGTHAENNKSKLAYHPEYKKLVDELIQLRKNMKTADEASAAKGRQAVNAAANRLRVYIDSGKTTLLPKTTKSRSLEENKPLSSMDTIKNEKENKTKKPSIESPKKQQLTTVKTLNDPQNADEFVITSSGLKYQIIVKGSGKEALAGKMVSVHYTGWLMDGTKFDSSLDRGTPFKFTLAAGRVIKGWDEGIAKMKVGGKRVLFIPSELAYGTRGAGKVIPPNSELKFEVKLLDVK